MARLTEGGRINYHLLKDKYGDAGPFDFYLIEIEGATICIGIDTFRYQIAYQEASEPNTVYEEYIDYVTLEDEGINPYNLRDVARFAVERGESYEVHEGVGNIIDYLKDDAALIKI